MLKLVYKTLNRFIHLEDSLSLIRPVEADEDGLKVLINANRISIRKVAKTLIFFQKIKDCAVVLNCETPLKCQEKDPFHPYHHWERYMGCLQQRKRQKNPRIEKM